MRDNDDKNMCYNLIHRNWYLLQFRIDPRLDSGCFLLHTFIRHSDWNQSDNAYIFKCYVENIEGIVEKIEINEMKSVRAMSAPGAMAAGSVWRCCSNRDTQRRQPTSELGVRCLQTGAGSMQSRPSPSPYLNRPLGFGCCPLGNRLEIELTHAERDEPRKPNDWLFCKARLAHPPTWFDDSYVRVCLFKY